MTDTNHNRLARFGTVLRGLAWAFVLCGVVLQYSRYVRESAQYRLELQHPSSAYSTPRQPDLWDGDMQNLVLFAIFIEVARKATSYVMYGVKKEEEPKQ